jgi:hypothetical protein
MPGFQDFLIAVLGEPALRDELLSLPDLPSLKARVLELGRARGMEITGEELDTVIHNNRRSWLERWVDL